MDSAPFAAPLSQASEGELPDVLHAEARNPTTPAEAAVPSLPELYAVAEAAAIGLTQSEFAHILLTVGERCLYNQPATAAASAAQREAFFRSLHLPELALAHACALGRDAAWQMFLARYREPLAQAATAMTGSVSLGRDLAEQLPSELFGLSAPEGQRRSPLASYSGRGSLMGWLRSTLAQRHIDRHRRTHREAPLDPLAEATLPAAEPAPTPSSTTLAHLQSALTAVLRELAPEDAFLLSAWYLDGRTLLQIARLLRVSEATVSRKAKRLTEKLHGMLLTFLQRDGLSHRAAEEALGTDPRDLTLNLRALLQTPAAAAFPDRTPARRPAEAHTKATR